MGNWRFGIFCKPGSLGSDGAPKWIQETRLSQQSFDTSFNFLPITFPYWNVHAIHAREGSVPLLSSFSTSFLVSCVNRPLCANRPLPSSVSSRKMGGITIHKNPQPVTLKELFVHLNFFLWVWKDSILTKIYLFCVFLFGYWTLNFNKEVPLQFLFFLVTLEFTDTSFFRLTKSI